MVTTETTRIATSLVSRVNVRMNKSKSRVSDCQVNHLAQCGIALLVPSIVRERNRVLHFVQKQRSASRKRCCTVAAIAIDIDTIQYQYQYQYRIVVLYSM
jgi:hypothetical protein